MILLQLRLVDDEMIKRNISISFYTWTFNVWCETVARDEVCDIEEPWCKTLLEQKLSQDFSLMFD